jgi:thymidylate synthase (FAD)
VLDHGFVRLVDYLGGDARIVQAARVSYGDGTKSVREDAALIDYLLRHAHTSPFEQVVLTFHLKMPIFVARQWIRHRTARLNELSGRYSVLRDEFYVPAPDEVRYQSTTNKQGSARRRCPTALRGRVVDALATASAAYAAYEGLLEDGVARELARINLPLSLYTEMYWQIDLHNLFHFLRLRMDWHAQYEIRAYGDAIARCARAVAPLAYEAFEEHVLARRRLSAAELAVLRSALDEGAPARGRRASDLRPTRRRELLEKLGLGPRGDAGGPEPCATASCASASPTAGRTARDRGYDPRLDALAPAELVGRETGGEGARPGVRRRAEAALDCAPRSGRARRRARRARSHVHHGGARRARRRPGPARRQPPDAVVGGADGLDEARARRGRRVLAALGPDARPRARAWRSCSSSSTGSSRGAAGHPYHRGEGLRMRRVRARAAPAMRSPHERWGRHGA